MTVNRKAKFIDMPAISIDELHKIAAQLGGEELTDFVFGLIGEMDEKQIETVTKWLAENY